MLAVIAILIFVFVMWMFVLVIPTLSQKERSVGGKQPPGVKPVRMGPSQPLPDGTSGQRAAPNARPMVMGPAQPWKMPIYQPDGVHLIVEYGTDRLILRVDSGNLTITGSDGYSHPLQQGDSYNLPITFQITMT